MENLFEYYIENENFHLKYAKGEPAIKEREFHQYYEFVILWKEIHILFLKTFNKN